MLHLKRGAGERIVIGDDIVVEVVSIGHGQVRLGVSAPRQIAVFRAELLDPARVPGSEAAGDAAPG